MHRNWKTSATLGLVLAVLAQPAAGQGLSRTFLSDMMYLEDSTSARVSSYDRSGRNTDFRGLGAGKELELANLDGPGCIRHIYFSIWGGRHYLRDLVLRMYWEGETEPSVEVPFGDFFGLGHERARFYQSLLVTVNPGDMGVFGTFGFNAYFPMPFSSKARLTLTNEGTQGVFAVWYHIEYEKVASIPDNVGHFHAQWNRENPTSPVGEQLNVQLHNGANPDGKENYVILDAKGHGNLVGYFLNIDNIVGGWYGEGDDMIFIDGEEWPPSFHGTGSEEIFGGGACPSAEYAGPYTGYHLIGNLDFAGKVSMYRFFVNDPVRFRKSIRMTIEHGHANNMRNDYSSTAFWYQTEPHVPFPPLPSAEERRPREGDDPHDRAYRTLIALQDKVRLAMSMVWRTGVEMPKDLADAVKYGVHEQYFNRDYAGVLAQCERLSAEIDAFIKNPGTPPSK